MSNHLFWSFNMQHSSTTKEKAANLYLDQLETNSMYFAEIKVLQLATDCRT